MNQSLDKLLGSKCRPIADENLALNLSEIETLRKLTPKWQYCATENEISQTFHFKKYDQTIDFVNKVAGVAEQEDHHPEMEVNFSRCKVRYSTHSVNGLTENDFICAAKIDQLD